MTVPPPASSTDLLSPVQEWGSHGGRRTSSLSSLCSCLNNSLWCPAPPPPALSQCSRVPACTVIQEGRSPRDLLLHTAADSKKCCNTAQYWWPKLVWTAAACNAADSRAALIWCFAAFEICQQRRTARRCYSSFSCKQVIKSCLFHLWVLQPATEVTAHKGKLLKGSEDGKVM